MKKFRGFTLLESLAVIGIVGIVSTAIFNMRNIGNDYTDYRKEASNIIYKEINQSLKDFQRNKVWIDPSGNAHKISSFQIKFGTQNSLLQGETKTLGPVLEIGSTYLYCLDKDKKIIDCFLNGEISTDVKEGSGFFDSNKLISKTIYTSPKKIKDIDKFEFLLEGGYKIDAINILSNGNIVEGDYIEGFKNDVEKSVSNSSQGDTSTYDGGDKKKYCKKAYESCLEQVPTASEGGSCYKPFGRDYRCCNHHSIVEWIEPPCTNPTASCVKCMNSSEKELWQELQMEKCLKNKGFDNIGCQEILLLSDSTLIDPSGGTENNTTSYSFTIYAAEKNGAKNCTINLESKNNNNGNSTQDLLNENEKETKNALVKFCLSDNFDDYFKQDIDHKVDQNQVKIADENFIKIDVNTTERLKIMKGLDFFINIRNKFPYLREKEQDSKEARDICKGMSERLNNHDPLSSSDKQKFLECCKGIVVINEEIEKKYSEGKGNETQPTTTNKKGKEWRPVGKITINTITKTASLERCNNDRESNGIDCGETYCY